MRFGCHLPVYGPAATRDTLVGFARRAEALGYDSLWASDHVVLPWRIASRDPYNATGDCPLSPRAGARQHSHLDRRPHAARAAPRGRAGRRLARSLSDGGRAEGRARAPAGGV